MSRILVVDDCPDTVGTYCRLLRRWGHEAHGALDGPSALALAAASPPDAALVDLNMPGMEGVEVALKLRRLPGLRRALVVAMTGGPGWPEAAEGTFDFLLRKPGDPVDLRRLLSGLPAPPRPPLPKVAAPSPTSDSAWQMICVGG